MIKSNMIFVLISGIALSCTAAEFDSGGTSFDFSEISKQRFASSSSENEENLVSNGNFETPLKKSNRLEGKWSSAAPIVHINDRKVAAELESSIKPFIVYKIVDSSEGKAACIKKDIQLEKICDSNTPHVSGSWMQLIKLPDQTGGRYKLSFRYRGEFTGKYAASAYTIMSFYDTSGKNNPIQGKQVRGAIVTGLPSPKSEWYNFSHEFESPSGTAWIMLYLRLYGTGEIFFDDIKLCKQKQELPIKVMLAPMSLLDNTFCLSSGDPAIMTFCWRRNVPKQQLQINKPALCVELPTSIKVLGVCNGLKIISQKAKNINGKQFNLYHIDLSSVKNRLQTTEDFDYYLRLALLVSTDAPAGTVLHEGHYWIEDDNKSVSAQKKFALQIISHIEIKNKPKIFMTGFYAGGPYMSFPEKKNKEILAKFIGNTGSSWIVEKPDQEMATLYRTNGIKIITPELYWVANGYRIGLPMNKPEYAQFKALGKSNDSDINNGTCPVAIYSLSDYFKNVVVPYLEQNLKGADGLWSNWEPYMFNGRGCFCDNCLKEFAKFSKTPESQVKKSWPDEMTAGKKYHDLWIKFRSWQHEKMLKTIDQAVNSCTSGKAGFIPGISWATTTDSKFGQNFGKEHNILDYGVNIKYINPWGPYVAWEAMQPYSYEKGRSLSVFFAGRKMRDFINKSFPNPQNRPRLLAFPHGLQCSEWVTQPEAVSMDILSFFLNRFDAAVVYIFPRGYDNRFWKEYTKANELIAKYENFVFNGKSIDTLEVCSETPYPRPLKKIIPKYFPGLSPHNLLQVVGYKLNNETLIAVGNFWEKGDVFFKLKVQGLDATQKYILLQPDENRYFAPEDKDFFTGSELTQGVMLHCGAERWAFFVIRPYQANVQYGRKITPDQIKSAMEKHLPKIEKAAKLEEKLDANETPKVSSVNIRKISNKQLVCFPQESDDVLSLKFVSGKNQMIIGLDSMAIKSWNIDNNQIVAAESGINNFGLGMPTFWEPPLMLNQLPWTVKKFESTTSGILISAEKYISSKINASLEFLRLSQTIEVGLNCRNVKVSTMLTNTGNPAKSNKNILLGFRYHNLPECLAEGGSILMQDDKTPIVFKRRFEKILFVSGSSPCVAKVASLFSVTQKIKVTAPAAVFTPPNSGLKITMTVSPADKLTGFACWDEPSMSTSSFEPCFETASLRPGQSTEYSINFSTANN